ncbi:MAG: nicotinate-nucleotide adenylyltransferase [Clostridia bacterium]|nr:nicotinate-nucleotide adenylyltransferase [Clostridia bacterium]
MREKIGIFGGTFDPVHKGHINGALCFKNELGLDKVLVIPTFTPPHKRSGSKTTESQRFEMTKLAFEGKDGFEVSDIEIKKGGISYTADTIELLKGKYKNADFYLYTGTDMFLCIDKWYNFRYILDNVILVCALREEDPKNEILLFKEKLEKLYNSKIIILDNSIFDISSTKIRADITCKKDVSEYLSFEVENYIKEKGLYEKQYIDVVKTMQSGHRLSHSLSVEKEAVRLAKIHGVDAEKASIAGILHDVTKKWEPAEQLTLCSQFGIIPDEIQKENHKLLHALSGYVFSKNILKIEDEEILQAIRYHTTGRPEMSDLEKIIFLADMTEPLRDFPKVDELRKIVDISLSEAMAFSLKLSLEKLSKENVPIHEDTKNAYDYYKEFLNG